MELTRRGLNGRFGINWIIALMVFIFAAVFLISLGTDIFYFFLFFSLPGILLFPLAFHLKRYAGAAAISFISLVLGALMANDALSWYEENQAIKYYPAIITLDFLILTIASALMAFSSPKSKEIFRQRLWTIIYNVILAVIFFVSLLFTIAFSCESTPSIFVLIYLPLLVVIILAVIASPIARVIHRCKLITRDSITNLALSLLFWGMFMAYPSYAYISSAGMGTACSRIPSMQPCTNYIYIGLLIYFILTTSIELALLIGKFLCGKSPIKHSP